MGRFSKLCANAHHDEWNSRSKHLVNLHARIGRSSVLFKAFDQRNERKLSDKFCTDCVITCTKKRSFTAKLPPNFTELLSYAKEIVSEFASSESSSSQDSTATTNTGLEKIPDERCDLPNCVQPSINTSMKILHGCGHSFHPECFPSGPGICKDKLVDAIKVLSEAASASILNPDSVPIVGDRDNDDKEKGDDGEEEFTTDEKGCDPATIADAFLELKREIFTWGLIPGPEA
eukprot:gene14983-6137_t